MKKGSDDKFSNDEFGVDGPAWAEGKIINEAIFWCERRDLKGWKTYKIHKINDFFQGTKSCRKAK